MVLHDVRLAPVRRRGCCHGFATLAPASLAAASATCDPAGWVVRRASTSVGNDRPDRDLGARLDQQFADGRRLPDLNFDDSLFSLDESNDVAAARRRLPV